MAESLVREILVESAKWERDGREVSISERQDSVFEGHFRSDDEFNRFCKLVTHRDVGTGETALADTLLLLRYSPFSTYIVSEQLKLEDFNSAHRDQLTDVSHGKCVLCFQGDAILNLFADYCSTDLFSGQNDEFQMVKTRFIDYEITIWWNSDVEINLLIDRSYAQSFVDFLHLLFDQR